MSRTKEHYHQQILQQDDLDLDYQYEQYLQQNTGLGIAQFLFESQQIQEWEQQEADREVSRHLIEAV